VDLPAEIVLSKGWQITPRPMKDEAGPGSWTRQFLLEPPLQPGELLDLQLAPLKYWEGNQPQKSVAWRPIRVRLVKPSLSALRDNTPPEKVPDAWSAGGAVSGVLAGLVLAVLALLLWHMARRRLGRAPKETPAGWALRELDKAAAIDFSVRANVERFALVLSDVVRRYVEMQFRVPASRRTTAEFFDDMRQAPQLAPEQRASLRSFLERCDLAKFARDIPTEEECRALAAEARRFVLSSHLEPCYDTSGISKMSPGQGS
jgi:hypothetical protein